jgi:hypothetical protein
MARPAGGERGVPGAGFEPTNGDFTDRCLGPLGYPGSSAQSTSPPPTSSKRFADARTLPASTDLGGQLLHTAEVAARERDNLPDPPRTTARRQAPFVSVVDLPAYPMTLASHPVRPRSPSRGTFGDRPGSKLGCSILNTRTGIRMRQQADPLRVTRHDDPAALGLDPVGLDALVCTLRQWHEAGEAGMQLAVYRHGILAIAVACGEDPFSGRPTDTTYCFVSSPPRRPWQQSRCSTSRVRVSSGGAMRSPITGCILHRAVRRLPQFEHLMRTLAVRSARRGAVSMSATETACLVVYQGRGRGERRGLERAGRGGRTR